jgi:glycosyltransferase involved in cell wall biosynthesis
MTSDVFIIVAAYNEADRIAATLAALAETFPGASLWVADDGSSDGTGTAAEAGGAAVVRSERVIGKGGAVTLAAREALASKGSVVLLCDGDLGESAARLGPLVEAVHKGEADLAVAAFSKRVGGGLGLAIGAPSAHLGTAGIESADARSGAAIRARLWLGDRHDDRCCTRGGARTGDRSGPVSSRDGQDARGIPPPWPTVGRLRARVLLQEIGSRR